MLPSDISLENNKISPFAMFGLLLAGVFSFFFLGDKSFWTDEIYSIALAAHNWGDMWQLLFSYEPNMWLYYVLLNLWLKLGESEILVRSLSVIFALGAVLVTYIFGTRFFNSRVGLISGLLLSVNAFFIRYAQEARSYSLLLLLTTASSYFFIKGMEKSSWQNWVGYIISSALAIYAHFFGILVLAAHAVSLVFFSKSKIPWKSLIRSALVIMLFLLPLVFFFFQVPAGDKIGWISEVRLVDIPKFFWIMFGQSHALLLVYFILCTFAICTIFKKFFYFKLDSKNWRYMFIISWLITPIILTFSFSFLSRPIYSPRYLIICLPPLILLVSIGLSAINCKWVFAVLLAMLIMSSGYGLLNWYVREEKENWRDTVNFVISRADPKDCILFYIYFMNMPFQYYLEKKECSNIHPEWLELASESYIPWGLYESIYPEPNKKLLENLSRKYTRVWLVLSHHRTTAQRQRHTGLIQNLLESNYVVAEDKNFRGIFVQLYERKNVN